jgi:hypothetical protein
MAPKACGLSLGKLLLKPAALKAAIIDNWDSKCANAVTTKHTMALIGAFATYVTNFDFAIFVQKPPLELIDEHRSTPFFAEHFGGGLKPRPQPGAPPATVQNHESRYVDQLYEAYSDHRKSKVTELNGLATWPSHVNIFIANGNISTMQRRFARDTVHPERSRICRVRCTRESLMFRPGNRMEVSYPIKTLSYPWAACP